MLKVMIVDDELIVRVGFQSCIRWEDYGCEVINTCQSGKEAIDGFKNQVPDIVFTDIMMPEMNGIELVKYIRNYYPKTKIVVLSCINEIDYVKKAIKYGAEDYILKLSLTPETLTEVLIKLRQDIERESRGAGSDAVYAKVQSLQRDEFLRRLLKTDMSEGDLGEQWDQLGIMYDPLEKFQVLCLLIDHFKEVYGARESDAYMMKNGLLNVAREYMGGLGKHEIFFCEDNELILIFRHAASEKDQEKKAEDKFKLLNRALKIHLNITVSGGSAVVDNRLQLSNAYQQARERASLRFFTGGGHYHSQDGGKENGFVTRRYLQKKLQEAIFKQEEVEAEKLLDTWYEQMGQCRTYRSLGQIKRSVVETWIFISGYSLPEEASFEEMDDREVISGIWEAETLEELKCVMHKAVSAILACLSLSKNTNSDIREFLSYLEINIAGNMTLEEASAKCLLGRSQFCILFKKATGETFINYVNRKKMEKAFTYLSSEHIQVQEAAYRVGMTDISYFNKLFKKYYEISPSEVKKGNIRKI